MLNNVEEYLDHLDNLKRLFYDPLSGKYFLQNASQVKASNDLCIEPIMAMKAQSLLKNDCLVPIRSIADAELAYKLHLPTGLIETLDGRQLYNIAQPNKYMKEFLKPEEEDVDFDQLLVKLLDEIIDSPREKHDFYSLITSYLSTGQPLNIPIKISDSRGYFTSLYNLLTKILGSVEAISWDVQQGCAAIHITRIKNKNDHPSSIHKMQQLLSRDVGETAGLQVLINSDNSEVHGLYNFNLSTQVRPVRLNMLNDKEIIEAIKYLRLFKEQPRYDTAKTKATVAEELKQEYIGYQKEYKLLRILTSEDWAALDAMFKKHEIPIYHAQWAGGHIIRKALNKLIKAEYGTGRIQSLINKAFKQYQDDNYRKLPNLKRVKDFSEWGSGTTSVEVWGPFPSLKEYYFDKMIGEKPDAS